MVATIGERQYLLRHTGIGSTLSLTEATVSAITASQVQLTGTRPRVHGNGLADDEAIADKLADGLARVGVGNLGDLVGIEPDLALTASDDGCRQALLSAEVDPSCGDGLAADFITRFDPTCDDGHPELALWIFFDVECVAEEILRMGWRPSTPQQMIV